MSAIESMIRTILNSMDIDVEEIKEETTRRIKAFEGNLQTLNTTLINHHASLARIEADLTTLFAHFGITRPATAQGNVTNGTGNPATPKQLGSDNPGA